jgi:hypothetical protein
VLDIDRRLVHNALVRSFHLMVLVVFTGCAAAVPAVDAGSATPDPLPDAGPSLDAGQAEDAGVRADAGCTGACATTSLTMRLRGRTAGFSRAQHGLAPDGRVLVEAHEGGDPACPTMTSPTPDRTLVIANLRVLPDGGAVTFADGLRVTLFDFSGALTTSPLERAVAARATPRFVQPGQLVSFELEATFDGGALTGAIAAPHCPSLDR